MKIATWNVNHRACCKAIPENIAPSIIAVDADILVFTEFVHCDHKKDRKEFYNNLDEAGYTYRLLSPTIPRENHILIASRIPVKKGELTAPGNIQSSVPSNFLHVKTINTDIEVIGIRVPDYSKSIYREVAKKYWSWFSEFSSKIADRALVLTGDFNIDPDMKKYKFRHHLNNLTQNHWTIAAPKTGASFWANKNNSPHRLDHAFLTSKLSFLNAKYVNQIEGFWKCGVNKYREPDHAILAIEVARQN